MATWSVDAAGAGAFERLVAPLFEQAPGFIDRLEAGRPYGSWEHLFERAAAVAAAMPVELQLELIDAHPRIGAPPDSVSALSFVEQGYDRERASEQAEAERTRLSSELERLNLAYEATFGFRYVVFVAGRSRASIVPLMEAALGAKRDDEIKRALHDVIAIARDRAIATGLMREGATPPRGSQEDET